MQSLTQNLPEWISKPLNRIKLLRDSNVVRHINVFKLAIKGFNEDRIQIRAGALTYLSVLSIVPVIAMIFGVAKGFGLDERLQTELQRSLAGQEEVLKFVIDASEKYLLNAKGGFIVGIGSIILIYTVMKLLSSIEVSFNHIWQIKKSRVLSRKISDYISLIFIAPILIIVSSSVNIFLNEQVEISSEAFPLIGYLGTFLGFIISLIPLLLIYLVFTLLYIVMPNTKVHFLSGLIGGIIAGTAFQLLQWGYIKFQSLLTGYGAIYGSLAALPLFLIWMRSSWLIVLFGAEVSFAKQNIEHYEAESESIDISNHLKRAVLLVVAREIFMQFKNALPPLTTDQLSERLNLPIRLVREIVSDMMETNLLSEIVTENVKENAYQPAQDINTLTVSSILEILDKKGKDNIREMSGKELDKMIKIVDDFSTLSQKSNYNKLVVEI